MVLISGTCCTHARHTRPSVPPRHTLNVHPHAPSFARTRRCLARALFLNRQTASSLRTTVYGATHDNVCDGCATSWRSFSE